MLVLSLAQLLYRVYLFTQSYNVSMKYGLLDIVRLGLSSTNFNIKFLFLKIISDSR